MRSSATVRRVASRIRRHLGTITRDTIVGTLILLAGLGYLVYMGQIDIPGLSLHNNSAPATLGANGTAGCADLVIAMLTGHQVDLPTTQTCFANQMVTQMSAPEFAAFAAHAAAPQPADYQEVGAVTEDTGGTMVVYAVKLADATTSSAAIAGQDSVFTLHLDPDGRVISIN